MIEQHPLLRFAHDPEMNHTAEQIKWYHKEINLRTKSDSNIKAYAKYLVNGYDAAVAINTILKLQLRNRLQIITNERNDWYSYVLDYVNISHDFDIAARLSSKDPMTKIRTYIAIKDLTHGKPKYKLIYDMSVLWLDNRFTHLEGISYHI